MDNVVCLSKKLESTPIFPVCAPYYADYNSELYIYVIALPDAELPGDLNTPQPIDVFDLEALQLQEFKKIMDNPDLSVNPAMAGYVLSGHEAFAKNVSTEDIICAVKCTRSDFAFTAGLPLYTKKIDDGAAYAFCQTRYFEIGHEIFLNNKYSQDEHYKTEAIDELREVRAKGLQPTTSVQDALDDNGIAYDKEDIHTSNYFWQELKSLNLGMAFFSILESIYYAAIQLCKCIESKSERKPIELIEGLPESMQEKYTKRPLSFYGRYFTTVGQMTGQVDPFTAYRIKHSF